MFFRTLFLAFLLGVFSQVVASEELKEGDTSEEHETFPERCDRAAVLVDPDFSPFFAANNFLFANQSVQKLVDAAFFEKRSSPYPTIDRLGRLIEVVAFAQLNIFTNVVTHEVFGHGYRVRSLGFEKAIVSGYHIGYKQGATGFLISPQLSTGESIAITIAGLEAQEIFAEEVKKRWLACGYTDARQSALYIMNRTTPISYAAIDRDVEFKSTEHLSGHDIRSYVSQLNLLYPGLDMEQSDVLALSLMNLLDPTLYNAFFGEAHYILFGENAPLWRFRLGRFAYVPMFTMYLAPYGPELALTVNMLDEVSKRMVTFYGKGGELKDTFFGGAGATVDPIWQRETYSLGARVDLWSQPDFINTPSFLDAWRREDPIPTPMSGRIVGLHAGLIGRVAVDEEQRNDLLIEAGYKARGYLPGFPLDNGPYVRLGFSFVY